MPDRCNRAANLMTGLSASRRITWQPNQLLLAAIDDSNGKAVSGGVSPRSIAAARSVEILSAIFLLFSCWCFYMADESSGLAEGNVEPLKASDGDGPPSGHPSGCYRAETSGLRYRMRDC